MVPKKIARLKDLLPHGKIKPCEHPFGGKPRCPLCGSYPSMTALLEEVNRRERHPKREQPKP